jgi:hypothetical protein
MIQTTHLLPNYDLGPGADELQIRKRRNLNAEERRKRGDDALPWSADVIRTAIEQGVRVTVRRRPILASCGATTRKGTPCRCIALRNGRCRLHGGLSTGPKSVEGWNRTREGHRAWLARRKVGVAQNLTKVDANSPRTRHGVNEPSPA